MCGSTYPSAVRWNPQTWLLLGPLAKSLTFWGFSGKPNLISTKKLKSKDPLPNSGIPCELGTAPVPRPCPRTRLPVDRRAPRRPVCGRGGGRGGGGGGGRGGGPSVLFLVSVLPIRVECQGHLSAHLPLTAKPPKASFKQ